jgi:DNA-directed RNA polymerase alpha subunit
MFGDLEQVEINMLTSLSRSELLKQRSMGQTSIQEIEERLGQYGLRLREAGKNSNA